MAEKTPENLVDNFEESKPQNEYEGLDIEALKNITPQTWDQTKDYTKVLRHLIFEIITSKFKDILDAYIWWQNQLLEFQASHPDHQKYIAYHQLIGSTTEKDRAPEMDWVGANSVKESLLSWDHKVDEAAKVANEAYDIAVAEAAAQKEKNTTN